MSGEMDDLDSAANRLLNGAQSPEDAKNCLAHFLNYWRINQVNPNVAKWIEQSLSDLIAGVIPADEALGLKLPPNRPRKHEKAMSIGAFLEYESRQGQGKNNAISLASEHFNADPKSIRDHINNLTDEDVNALKFLTNAELKALFQAGEK
jgi:hypothetical protein